jgi:hypothetical protein
VASFLFFEPLIRKIIQQNGNAMFPRGKMMTDDRNVDEFTKDDILSILRSENHLSTGNHPFRYIRQEAEQYLRRESRAEEYLSPATAQIYKYYKGLFGLIEARPGDSLRQRTFDAAYVYADNDALGQLNLVNTEQGMANFFKSASSTTGLNYLLEGKRGSGKTLFLNHFLMKYSTELYKRKRIWFRANVSHLHNKNAKRSALDEDPAHFYNKLDEFIHMHVAYITLRYHKNTPIFKEYIEESNKGSIYDKGQTNREIVEEKYKVVIRPYREMFSDFYGFISTKCSNAPDSYRNMVLRMNELLDYKNKNGLYYEIIAISKTIMDFIRDRGFSIILILDGVDNIDYFEHRALYNDLIKELSELAHNRDGFSTNDNFIYGVRPESSAEIRALLRHQDYTNLEPLYIKPVSPKEALKRRIDLAPAPGATLYGRNYNKTVNHIETAENCDSRKAKATLETENEDLKNIVSDYIKSIYDALIEVSPQDCMQLLGANEDEFVRVVYNDNLRDVMFNALHTYLYSSLWREKKDAKLHDRNYVWYEAQLLNGHLYLNSDENQSEHGQVIKNIFYYRIERAERRNAIEWHGLVSLRILQYLQSIGGEGAEDRDIIKYICESFHYDNKLVRARLTKGLTGGLIKCRYHGEKVLHELTEKGSLHIKYPFFSADIMYNLALDTPLPAYLFDDTKYILFHDNKDRFWNGYAQAIIITVITFLRILIAKHNSEMEKLSDEKRPIFEWLEENLIERVIEDIMKHADALKRIDIESYKEIAKKIQELKFKSENP